MARRPDWSDDEIAVLYEEPCYVPGPDDSKFFMGAQVGWSRDRESPPPTSTTCPLCNDSIADLMGHDGVCAKCLAWTDDARLGAAIIADLGRRGTTEPVEVATIFVTPYRDPFPPSQVDPDTGRPFAERFRRRARKIQFTPKGKGRG